MEPTRYRITGQGRTSERLRPAFDRLDVEPGNVQNNLVGKIRNQSDLFDMLGLVCALGLQLVSVEPDGATSRPR